MIRVNDKIEISEKEIHLEFIRAPGPGGQNVNKVASAVQLSFDVLGSLSLPPDVQERLQKIAGKRITKEGVLIITARRYRTQQKNREDAIARLVHLIERALVKPKPRKKTKPTDASKERRLEEKKRRSKVKQNRTKKLSEDD